MSNESITSILCPVISLDYLGYGYCCYSSSSIDQSIEDGFTSGCSTCYNAHPYKINSWPLRCIDQDHQWKDRFKNLSRHCAVYTWNISRESFLIPKGYDTLLVWCQSRLQTENIFHIVYNFYLLENLKLIVSSGNILYLSIHTILIMDFNILPYCPKLILIENTLTDPVL